ncbi:alpha-glucuronidase family glycosyl hydrolase [Paraflavisolibacter sp. H34]|uniref:alpha-glucuronidase family glycosyl hydrolase n=1 Tax=Huijunlia imazamoxiresistens TaxID=3127457 RepID=UPI003019BF31
MKRLFASLLFLLILSGARAEDGYRLWLRYDKITDTRLLQQYGSRITGLQVVGSSPTLAAAKEELLGGLQGLLGRTVPAQTTTASGSLLVGSAEGSARIKGLVPAADLQKLGKEGFLLRTVTENGKKITLITGNTDIGVLYGAFHFLRLLQTGQPIDNLSLVSAPKTGLRLLNHWDNLNRHVERGYAGGSIWDWHRLPDYIDPRYKDYARANASIGINGTVLTNVNANALVLTEPYLQKVAALAAVFRPYGLKVYLTARFSAPVEIGGLKTADPLDPAVQQWWKDKTKEIYRIIPDFGGFLVKANSEGQPGPQNYGRNHADGANMMADALAPFGGVVMWRAFVYSSETPEDRFKQAYSEFKPLDGKFRENVLVQVKNGPIDFQPREPFHPLFGAMPQTPLMMEFQITQEYKGFATHLVFLPSEFKETLDADTYAKGQGSTVAEVVDGTLEGHRLSGMAGVANIGSDRNWTGHLFGQANWYGLGRLAWDHNLTAETIAAEWARQTFGAATLESVKKILLASDEAMINYMTPLGLHHIMGYGHHYGPAPWYDKAARADWNPVYFHKADSAGIGFDRTATGSNALAQYAAPVRKLFEDPNTCPEKYLLWFHHVPWTRKMASGRNLWQELCAKYNEGVDSVRRMQQTWNSLKGQVDAERFEHVRMLLAIQEKEAVWWRDACLVYFQKFSKMPFPPGFPKPAHTLDYYKNESFPYAPGN